MTGRLSCLLCMLNCVLKWSRCVAARCILIESVNCDHITTGLIWSPSGAADNWAPWMRTRTSGCMYRCLRGITHFAHCVVILIGTYGHHICMLTAFIYFLLLKCPSFVVSRHPTPFFHFFFHQTIKLVNFCAQDVSVFLSLVYLCHHRYCCRVFKVQLNNLKS